MATPVEIAKEESGKHCACFPSECKIGEDFAKYVLVEGGLPAVERFIGAVIMEDGSERCQVLDPELHHEKWKTLWQSLKNDDICKSELESAAELFTEEVGVQREPNFREVTLKVVKKLLRKDRPLTMAHFLVFCGLLAFIKMPLLSVGFMVHEFANASYLILLTIRGDDEDGVAV